MNKFYRITWTEIIPEIFNNVPNLDRNYKLSDKTIVRISWYNNDTIRFDFNMNADFYEFEIQNDDNDFIINNIVYTYYTIRIYSTKLHKFVKSQLQAGSDTIILPLLG